MEEIGGGSCHKSDHICLVYLLETEYGSIQNIKHCCAVRYSHPNADLKTGSVAAPVGMHRGNGTDWKMEEYPAV